jgi:AcrR family transcriptional regulator
MSQTADASPVVGSRERLLAAALDSFAEKGFHGTTTRDIAGAAGMSPAALYVHHKSKEELLYLITLNGNQTALARLEGSIACSDDPAEQLRCAVRDFATASARYRTITRVINNELAALSPEHRSEIRALRQQIGDRIIRLIERGLEAGVFQVSDPTIAATAVMSLGIDVSRWYRDGGRWSPEDVGQHIAEMALRIVGAPATDRPENAHPPAAPASDEPAASRPKGSRKG